MACPGCGGAFRKGTLVLLLSNPPRRARVCPACARRAIALVAPTVAPVVRVARKPDDVVAGAIRQLRAYAGAAGMLAKDATKNARERAHFTGRSEAFEGAIQLLQSFVKAGA